MTETKRPTTTVSTPNGHTAEVYTYITARERMAATKALGAISAENISIDGAEAGQSSLVSSMVVLLDESAEGVYQRCLDLPSEDFDAILKAATEAASPQKKTS